MKKIFLVLLLALTLVGCGPDVPRDVSPKVYSFKKINDNGVVEAWYWYQVFNHGQYYTFQSSDRVDVRAARMAGFSGWSSSSKPIAKEELEQVEAEEDLQAQDEAVEEISQAESEMPEAANDPNYDSPESPSDVSDSSSSGDSGFSDSGGGDSGGGGDF